MHRLGFALLLMTAALGAQQIGEPAPGLQIAEWIVGEEVDLAGPRVTVILFSATDPENPPAIHEQLQGFIDLDIPDKLVTCVLLIDSEPFRGMKRWFNSMRMDFLCRLARDADGKTFEAYAQSGDLDADQLIVVDQQGRLMWRRKTDSSRVVERLLAEDLEVEEAKEWDDRLELWQCYQSYSDWVRQAEVDQEELAALTARILELGYANPRTLEIFAEQLLVRNPVALRDPELALEVARQANEAMEWSSPDTIAIYALALYQLERFPKAVEQQQRALNLEREQQASGDSMNLEGVDEHRIEQLLEALERYREAAR